MSDLRSITPSNYQEFQVVIVSARGTTYDITANVSKLEIFESIFEKSMTAKMTVVDNANIINNVPIVGQEVVAIGLKYKDTDHEIGFRVSQIEEVKSINDNSGIYVIRMVSEQRYLSAMNLFSRAYKGRNTEIISKIHSDYISPVEVLSRGGTSHQIAFPYMKPYQAIDMILKKTYCENNTPLFLYETLNGGKVYLKSYYDMMTDDEPVVIKNGNMINTDPDGQPRDMAEQNRNAFEQIIREGYSTFKALRNGALAAFVTEIDISGKTYTEDRFDYKKHAPVINSELQDVLSDDFNINDVKLNENFNNHQLYFVKDSKAYASENVGNVYQVDPISKAAMMSYRTRMQTQFVQILADNNENIQCGKLIDVTFRRMVPNIDDQEDLDKYNSGKYLCTSVKHEIKGGKYNIVIEAARFGINKEAQA